MAAFDATRMVAGQAGQGLQAVGGLLAKAFAKQGLQIFAHQDYMSRVRGGHNFFQVRVASEPVFASLEHLDVLIALDDASIGLHTDQLRPGGVIIYDGEKLKATCEKAECFSVPLERLAQEAGSKVMMNAVAVGAVWGLFNGPIEIVEKSLAEQFQDKGDAVVQANVKAAQSGLRYQKANYRGKCCRDMPAQGSGHFLIMKGNDAIALGALAAGCQFVSGYPMTPSTAITEYMAAKADQLGLVMEQAEDEIAAIHLALGASFAGCRSMVATSGGGFCLMVEALSFAGCSETPVVIIEAQRPGPSTGLPTRTEQADLEFVLYAGHGDFPRGILAPGSIEEAFYLTAKAFNLADKYQLPVIVMSDQHLADSYRTVPAFDLSRTSIDRGDLLSRQQMADATDYRRHRVTESGISPRALPGLGRALVVTAGDEHDEYGHLIEDADTRNQQVSKRMRKLDAMRHDLGPPTVYGKEDAPLALVGWGSTQGAMREAVQTLISQGTPVRGVHVAEIWPFPAEAFRKSLDGAQRVVFVENNFMGHFARLVRTETGLLPNAVIAKYDGRPFTPEHILRELGKVV